MNFQGNGTWHLGDSVFRFHKQKLEVIFLLNVSFSKQHENFLILEDIFNYARDNGILTGCARGCFHQKNKVITTNGVKYINEVNVGDEVVGHLRNKNVVTNIFEYDCEEELLDFSVGENSIDGVTKDHKIYAIKKQDYESGSRIPAWCTAESLEEGDYVAKISETAS